MEITKKTITEFCLHGLSQSEGQSMMYGNTPSEEVRLHHAVMRMKPFADYETGDIGIGASVNWIFEKISGKTIAEIERIAERMNGIG